MVALTSAVCVWWKLRSGESTTPPQRGCLLIGSTAASERATTCNMEWAKHAWTTKGEDGCFGDNDTSTGERLHQIAA